MGVRGLMSYILNDHRNVIQNVDLVSFAANEERSVELLVDFICFEYWLLRKLTKVFTDDKTNSQWLTMTGGEYADLRSFMSGMISLLQECGISMRFIVDGAKFSSTYQGSVKMNEWHHRDKKDWGKVVSVLNVAKDGGLADISDAAPTYHREDFLRPVLMEAELIRYISEQPNCSILCSVNGEADTLIARDFLHRKRNGNAFAILTADSDFMLIDGCRMIELESLFDISDHLFNAMADRQRGIPNIRLKRLNVGVIEARDVFREIGLLDMAHVGDFAFSVGNDSSKPFRELIRNAFPIRSFSFEVVASYLSKNGPLLAGNNHTSKILDDLARRNQAFHRAYLHTHDFYRLETSNLEYYESDISKIDEVYRDLQNVLQDAVMSCRLPPETLSQSRGFYWHHVYVEDATGDEGRTSETALAPFRKLLYQFLVARNLPDGRITEYVTLPEKEDVRTLTMCIHNTSDASLSLPKFHHTAKMSVEKRTELFHSTILLYVSESWPKFYEAFDWADAFRIYMARVFCRIMSDTSKPLSKDEALSAIATILGCDSPANIILCQAIRYKPSKRSLTVGTWLQNVYRHLGYFLANILMLSDVPPPSKIFAGSVFSAFLGCVDEERKMLPKQVQQIQNVRRRILEDNKRVVTAIIDGFSFD